MSNQLQEPLLTSAQEDEQQQQQHQEQQQQQQQGVDDNDALNRLSAQHLPAGTKRPPRTSFFGQASSLATGALFGHAPRGVVDVVPHPSKPCLLFSDACPISARAHIALLEKEAFRIAGKVQQNSNDVTRDITRDITHDVSGDVSKKDKEDEVKLAARTLAATLQRSSKQMTMPQLLPTQPDLFAVVHVCEPLAKHNDPGSRLLKKLAGRSLAVPGGVPVGAPLGNPVGTPAGSLGSHSGIEVPVLLHDTNILTEKSGMLLPEYIDDAVGHRGLLKPREAVGVYNMRLFLQRHAPLSDLFHQLLTTQHHSPHRTDLSTRLLSLLKLIDSDLSTFEGPYLLGSLFSLADIHIYPIIERIVVVLAHYRNFWIPPSLSNLIRWYEVVSARPAIRVATADRTPASLQAYCFEKVNRREYLLEVYECIAKNQLDQFFELNAKYGKVGVNVYKDHMDEEERDVKRLCENTTKNCQKCIIS